jgi:hypothetical protein
MGGCEVWVVGWVVELWKAEHVVDRCALQKAGCGTWTGVRGETVCVVDECVIQKVGCGI